MTYSEHNASNRPVATGQQSTPVQIDGGNASFWSASGNLAYYVPFFGDFICDPFSGFCDGGVGVADAVVASRDVTKFGWNVGVGAEFARSTDSPGSSKPALIASPLARRSNIYRS